MKLKKNELVKVKSAIDFILSKYEHFRDFKEDLEIKDSEIDEYLLNQNYELPAFEFPSEEDATEISLKDFLQIADEIPTISIVNNSIIRTNKRCFYIVEPNNQIERFIIEDHFDLKSKYGTTEFRIVTNNFIVGLAAVEVGEYDSDYGGTISAHMAVEIKYKNAKDTLDPNKELELINAYLFEISDSIGYAFSLSKIKNPNEEFEDLSDDAKEKGNVKLRDIEEFNDGMRLFVSANQIQEEELKFLNYYKILEHFAPIAVNLEALELMRKKLDAPKSSMESGDYIRSIFELAKSTRDKFNDEELIKATPLICFDFIGIAGELPESILKKIKKQIGESKITYSTERQKIITASNMIGKIIYETRNKVVHAKSNYNNTGNECPSSELFALNDFMKKACSQAIRWYNRQPNHLKSEQFL